MDLNKMDGLLVLEVIDSNPNGDPDRENAPRQRDNGLGEISAVSVKRKLRDLIEFKENNFIWEEVGADLDLDSDEYCIFESPSINRAAAEKLAKNDPDAFLNKYWDVRVFGTTFAKAEFIRTGPVHFGVGRSVSPIKTLEETFTKKAPVEDGKKRAMAPQAFKIVEYGIYTVPLFFSPQVAVHTKFRKKDMELFFKLIPYMYEHTRSMIRSQINILHTHVGWHSNKTGMFKPTVFQKALTPFNTIYPNEPGESIDDFTIPTWGDVKDDFPNVAKYVDII